jgi:transposase-like protein
MAEFRPICPTCGGDVKRAKLVAGITDPIPRFKCENCGILINPNYASN